MAQHAADFQPCTVAQQHVFDDGQAQPGAAGVGVAAGVDAVEALGQAGQVLGVDADTGILHAQVCAVLVGPPADADIALVLGVLHGVEHQVGKSAAQLALTAFEQNQRVGFQTDLLPAFTGKRLGVVLDGLQQALHRHRMVIRRVVGGLKLGQQQQVVEQCLHA